jgi:hypothetical protein
MFGSGIRHTGFVTNNNAQSTVPNGLWDWSAVADRANNSGSMLGQGKIIRLMEMGQQKYAKNTLSRFHFMIN